MITMDKALNIFMISAMTLLGLLLIFMIVVAVKVSNEREATREACTELGGIPFREYRGGIICLDKSIVKIP
jgi:hypothetical protein